MTKEFQTSLLPPRSQIQGMTNTTIEMKTKNELNKAGPLVGGSRGILNWQEDKEDVETVQAISAAGLPVTCREGLAFIVAKEISTLP